MLNPISLNLCSPSDVYTESVPSDVCKSAFDAIVIFAASFLESASPPISTLDASFNQAFLLLIIFKSWLDKLLELSPLPNNFCLIWIWFLTNPSNFSPTIFDITNHYLSSQMRFELLLYFVVF